MDLHIIDWVIIVAYLVFALTIGIIFSKRAGQNISEYFISGRKLPWWIAGTSMVATTFAADTPLAITGFVATEGIAGNWLWWNMAASGMLAVFFFARFWRRANILTDVELIELRYSGKPASFLRGFRAVYEGIVMNGIVMGWVILAMTKILGVFFNFDKMFAIVICIIIALVYTVLSGFWGVVITDFIQFFLAMGGSIVLAVVCTNDLGGISVLYEKLSPEVFNFFPQIGGKLMPITTFVAYISVNWWATKAADGGGYIAQRVFSAKDEKHSFFAVLWYNIAHYALRPWPWIIVALFSMVAYGQLDDPELGYPMMIADYMPVAFKGMMVAAFLAAFMSTIDTQLNWGSSLLVNDFYKRFINGKGTDKHYVNASRLFSVILMFTSAIITLSMSSIGGAWKLFFQLTAGIGGVYIARWFWWRVNAWSEITAWFASSLMTILISFVFPGWEYGICLMVTAGASTAAWLIVTLSTKPVDEEKLISFYKRVRPSSGGWRHIEEKIFKGEVPKSGIGNDVINWFAGVVLVYCFLFGIGKLVLLQYMPALIYFLFAVISCVWIYKDISKRGWIASE